MKRVIKGISILVSVLMIISTFIFLPNVTSAKETVKVRNVPKSEAPKDGKSFKKVTEKIDLTPKGVTTYKKYKEPSGVYRVVIKPVVKTVEAEKPMGVNAVNSAFPGSGIAQMTDYISLTSTNGAITTKSPTSNPPYPPNIALEIENSMNNNMTPPPPVTAVQSFTYVMYDFTGVLTHKDMLLDSYLDFSTTMRPARCQFRLMFIMPVQIGHQPP